MDEHVVKQKIQNAYQEPGAPEELIQRLVPRAQAVAMGAAAQKQLEAAPAGKVSELVSRVLIGQLAAVSELPKGVQPQQLARMLEQEPAFAAALRGGNVAKRLSSGEFLQQLTNPEPTPEKEAPQLSVPQKTGPMMK